MRNNIFSRRDAKPLSFIFVAFYIAPSRKTLLFDDGRRNNKKEKKTLHNFLREPILKK